MEFLSGNRNRLKALFNMSTLTPVMKNHVQNVYQLLALCIGVFSASIYMSIHSMINVNQNAAHFIAFGLVLYIGVTSITRGSDGNSFWRVAALLLFSFLEGSQVSHLVGTILKIDPSIVFTAAAATTVVFVSFSLAALLSERRSFLYLGGILMTSINYMLLLSLCAWLFPGLRQLNFGIHLYGGLILFSFYIIFDTQMMMENAAIRGKDADVVSDALSLFIDIVAIFVRILIILAKEAAKEKKKD